MSVPPQSKESDQFSHRQLCHNCKTKSCCTDFAEPILFPTDIKKLDAIKKSSSDYIQEVKMKNKSVRTIRTRAGLQSCIFFNHEKNFCGIYENRPFDCRMFPFDIAWIENEYHWIIYSCNSNSDWSWTEDHLEKLEKDSQFSEVIKNIEVFRLVTRNHVNNNDSSFVVLRKVIVRNEND